MSGLLEELAEALCVIYGDVIDEALHDADALLPIIERHAAARAAEELHRACAEDRTAAHRFSPVEVLTLSVVKVGDLLTRAAALDGQAQP